MILTNHSNVKILHDKCCEGEGACNTVKVGLDLV
jgi:hypothetical protein